MPRVYATPEQYQAYTGQAPDADTSRLLTRASEMLDRAVLRACWYQVDTVTGMPTDSVVLAALADATCAQVQWWGELGDSTGSSAVGWGTVKIGSAQLSRSADSVSGGDSPARQLAPAVWDALQSPDMTPDRFVLGMVAT
ncbi:hypothetical protein BX265_4950 [Streptomyces sp. TLI_235]|nr:hypothetical protein [Streptomyces sp. TLI_235]PBC80114.1 hypothetical protein BX265_4950 [Streptomyces sp. TLI_235]